MKIKRELIDDDEKIKSHLMSFFRYPYTNPNVVKPRLENLSFNCINDCLKDWLEKPILEESEEGDLGFGG